MIFFKMIFLLTFCNFYWGGWVDKITARFILGHLKRLVCSPSDALDYTEKWLEDTFKGLRDEAEADSSSAAASDRPTLLPLSVHNHAYIRLLKWDHASDPFPEVNDTGERPKMRHSAHL